MPARGKVSTLCGKLGIDPMDLSLLGGGLMCQPNV